MEWFQAGGFGMFTILILGAASIVVGVMAIKQPTDGKIAALRSLPSLITLSALFTFGTNLWAVNTHLSDEAFLQARNIATDQLSFVALIGVTEAGQALTLGGLMAMFVVALRIVAEVMRARGAGATA